MPFGLINASATFQRQIQMILRPLLEKGILVYLNDILIASEEEEKYKKKMV